MVAPALDRQQVGLDGLRHELVPDLETVVRPFDEEAVIERLDDAGPQVGIEDAVAPARARRGARRQALDELLEGRCDGGQLGAVQRAARRRDEAEDAAHLGGAAREPGEHELAERRPEGHPGQLAASGEHLLDDERVAPGALGDQEQRGGGRALALDLGDELGQVDAVQRPELDLGGRVGCAVDGGELRLERRGRGSGDRARR